MGRPKPSPAPKPATIGGLEALGAVRDALREDARRKAEAQARERAERERLARERDVFRAALADAVPLAPTGSTPTRRCRTAAPAWARTCPGD